MTAKETELIDEYKSIEKRREDLEKEMETKPSDYKHIHKQYTSYGDLLCIIYWRLLDKHGIDMHIYKG